MTDTESPPDAPRPIQLITVNVGGTSTWSRTEIYYDDVPEAAELLSQQGGGSLRIGSGC